MDVYLDDIIIYSDTVEEHLEHIHKVFEILHHEKLFLSTEKMQFFTSRLKILGHIINEQGIMMDPHKVTTILNWKMPTNKDLLANFIRAVRFLANNCKGIWIPMGVLMQLSSGSKAWRWGYTEQHAFDEVKQLVDKWQNNHRVSIDY